MTGRQRVFAVADALFAFPRHCCDWLPDELWELAGPLVPKFAPRAALTAIMHVLTSGRAWRHLPAEFGVSVLTAHRRFTA
jgi:transposase